MKPRPDPGVDQLGALELFAGCLRSELEFVRRHGTAARLPPGSVLMRQGDPGHEVVVLLAGTVDVRIGDRTITSLGRGSVFGEVSVLDHRPRTATVVTTSAVDVFVSTAQEFQRIVHRCPGVTRRLLSVVASRVRTSTASFTESVHAAAGA